MAVFIKASYVTNIQLIDPTLPTFLVQQSKALATSLQFKNGCYTGM